MKSSIKRSVVALVAGCALILLSASPASATTYPFNATYESGRIRVSNSFPFPSQNFDNPSGGAPAPCPSTSGISGSVDDVLNTINVTLNLQSVFEFPVGSGNWFKLSASGTGNGAYNPVTRNFSGVAINPISFTLSSITLPGCTLATLCTGTASLTASGQALSPPPFTTGELFKVNASGSITSQSGCGLPFSLIIRTGSGLSLSDNPIDCYVTPGTPVPPPPPALQTCGVGSSPDGAAIFRQM